jgi:hypothetical protein
MKRRIVAVDPAPAKASTFFGELDGVSKSTCNTLSFEQISAKEVVNKVAGLAEDKSIFLAWDSPLTGPSEKTDPGKQERDFSQRLIESFFSRKETGFKTPKGISTLPYSQCPHWAITKACLGLPLLGGPEENEESLPFILLDSSIAHLPNAPCVVEIHPAVAIWLWCEWGNGNCTKPKSYAYKRSTEDFKAVLRRLFGVWQQYNLDWLNLLLDFMQKRPALEHPKGDDELDALTGYVLARMFLGHKPNNSVTILGTKRTGSMLLPNLNGIQVKFDEYINASHTKSRRD